MSDSRENLEKKAQRAIWQHAIFRWESAVVISLTLLMSVLGPDNIPAWGWLLGGILGEGALIYSSLKDVEFGQRVVANLLKEQFKPTQLRTKELQNQINKALDYRSRIAAAIQEKDEGILKDHLTQVASQIDDWLENIYNLAQRLDKYEEQKSVLGRDKKRASERVQELRRKLMHESNGQVRTQIEITIDSMDRQLETIETVDNTMERAALQLENSLSHLGTIYSQAVLVGAKDIDSGRAQRLQQEIAEEVVGLSDILSTMDEVYASRA